MDPLRCLRDFCIKGRLDDIKSVNDATLSFGDEYEFAKNAETAFANTQDMAGSYTLDALLFFIKSRKDPNLTQSSTKNAWNLAYVNKAVAEGIDRIALVDRENVVKYLTGEVEHVPNLRYDDAAFLATQKRTREEDGVQPSTKRLRYADFEVQLRGRHNMLVIEGKDFTPVIKQYHKARQSYGDAMRAKDQARADRSKMARPSNGTRTEAKPSSRLDRGPQAESQQAQQIGVKYYRERGAPPPPPPPGGSAQPPPPPPPSATQQHRHNQSRESSRHRHQHPGDSDHRPIIIAPAVEGSSARVTLHNVKQLLQAGEYVEPLEAKKRFGAQQHIVTVQRESVVRPQQKVTFEVVDKPPSKDSKRWKRVVAVIVLGKKWQLKDFPFSGDPVKLFSSICGYYFHFEDEPVPAEVQKWNVTVLALKRNTRHDDVTLAGKFFEVLRRFLDNRVKLGNPKGSMLEPTALVYK